MGRSLTFRTAEATLAELERRAGQIRVPKTALAERYVQEGLAMDTFPGIVFRDGPAGRRPGVIGGPDVWEVVQVFLAEDRDSATTAKNLGLRPGLVEAAVAYYAAHRDSIAGWIDANSRLMADASRIVEQSVEQVKKLA